MKCRANEKKKDLGVDELLGVGREWSSECVESPFPGGSEGCGPAECHVTSATSGFLPVQGRAGRREGLGSGVRQTCMQTTASSLVTCAALGKSCPWSEPQFPHV